IAERIYQIEGVRTEMQTRRVWLTRPMYDLDLARMLAADRTILDAATQPSFPAARAMLAAHSLPPPGVTLAGGKVAPRFSRVTSDKMLGYLDRIIETDMRVRTERRFAAVSLAAALYRADHQNA